jgi:prolyl-tRNA synthetase
MKQSNLFTKTRKEAPKDEVSKNAQLLIRAGYIHKEMAGVYSFLPLGLRVIKKIENIIREEMDGIGGTEMRTSVFQNKEVWEKSNRWDDEIVDNWFKTNLKNGGEIGLSFTNEEAFANILKQYINSYKDLPVYAYDFKDIFRNEARSKSGILRGREFFWKALYSFSKNKEEHDVFYSKAQTAYQNIFKRAGLGDVTYKTFALGGSFSKYSHEFQTICDAGEDLIYLDEEKNISINKEAMSPEVFAELGVDQNKLVEKKAIEVGNIFSLGTKFSEPFDLKYKDESGNEQFVIMGSYGIGLGRLMGTIVEVLSDEKGIVWPESVAPFKVHLISLGADEKVQSEALRIYNLLSSKNVDVLWDDRDLRPGEKFSDSDLIGIPYRVVVSTKTVEVNVFEVKGRTDMDASMMTEDELLAKVA